LKELSLYEKLKEYGSSDFYPYHMPGHKRNAYPGVLEDIADIDITEIDGFDNLAEPEGIIKEALVRAAKICHADYSYFLVNGSTVGALVAISATVKKGGKLLLSRNCHKSAYHASYLRNLELQYIFPDVIPGFEVPEAVNAHQIEDALSCDGDIEAVMIVSPTYEGRVADVKAIAEVVHKYNIPLIVDEAHGSHLVFADGVDGFGMSACDTGADLVIQSTHKTLPAPTQTALLHINGNLVKKSLVERFIRIYQTSSPSYPLICGIDEALKYMEENGKSDLLAMKMAFDELVSSINNRCKYVEVLVSSNNTLQDIGKLVISARKAGITGKELSDGLRHVFHLELEMCTQTYALAMFTVADSEEAYSRMTDALLQIDDNLIQINASLTQIDANLTQVDVNLRQMDKCVQPVVYNSGICSVNKVLTLAEAWDAETETVMIENAEGRVAGDFVTFYPPGIPILVPGERIARTHIEEIINAYHIGLNVTGISLKEHLSDGVDCIELQCAIF